VSRRADLSPLEESGGGPTRALVLDQLQLCYRAFQGPFCWQWVYLEIINLFLALLRFSGFAVGGVGRDD